ncbi:MAG: hypothetical protein QMD36_03050 [Candidatus Aenigmarchaeota archaeon]|nr:hypothetical protein [Candidatus Aenigmarchaeota archaeon]
MYRCKSCEKIFSDKKLKHKSYNLGHMLEETNRIINKRFKQKVPKSTIHSWIKSYADVCIFTSLRKRFKDINPESIIKSRKFHHQQVYHFRFHTKAELANE